MKNLELIKETMSSIEIAELTGKEHKNVMAAIRTMESSWVKAGRLNFKLSSYINSQNKEQPMYWEQNLAMCRDTNCPAVLTENFFQDNKEDVEYLLSGGGKKAVAQIHIDGIVAYLKGGAV